MGFERIDNELNVVGQLYLEHLATSMDFCTFDGSGKSFVFEFLFDALGGQGSYALRSYQTAGDNESVSSSQANSALSNEEL